MSENNTFPLFSPFNNQPPITGGMMIPYNNNLIKFINNEEIEEHKEEVENNPVEVPDTSDSKKPRKCVENYTYNAFKIRHLKRLLELVQGKYNTVIDEFETAFEQHRNELTPFQFNLHTCIVHDEDFVLERQLDEVVYEERFKKEEWNGDIFEKIFNQK